MSTATAPAPTPSVVQRVTQWRVVVSEWTKLRSLRSTFWSLLAAVVFILAFSALVPAVVVAHWPPDNPADRIGFDPEAVSLAGIFLAQLAIGVLGALFITGEYATGMIRATFSAVPRRLPVLWAKTIVFAATSLLVTIPAVIAAFLIGQAILSSQHIDTSLGHGAVLRAVIGSALFITVVGVLGLALGAVLRHTAGAIATLFGMLFVLPVIVHFLPSSWSDRINKYLPGEAGQTITRVHRDGNTLSPWVGLLVFVLYAAVALALAAAELRRRDA